MVFDAKEHIKILLKSAHSHLAPAPVGTIAPGIFPVTARAPTSLTKLLTLHILQQSQFQFLSHTPAPYAGTPPPSAQPLVLSAPPSPTKHCLITIDEFCTYYNVSQANRKHLDKLDYQPGDAIDKLEQVDWHDEAGFAKLGWERMLGTHHCFLRDV